MVSEQEQSKQLESIKTLGNKKLDASELNFLKSQDKLLLDFKETSERNLLTDIGETNVESFKNNDTVRQILSSFYMKPDTFAKSL